MRQVLIRTLLLSVVTLPLCGPLAADGDWRAISYQLKLIDLLDREDGYCVDVVGSGELIRFDMPLIAHNCKPGLYADEAVVHRDDGSVYFPAYDGCLTVMGLNDYALPFNSLMIKRCHQDEPFLKATNFQTFSINKNNQLQLDNSELCLTVGGLARETFSSDHRWRSLYMQACDRAKAALSQWRFHRPTI